MFLIFQRKNLPDDILGDRVFGGRFFGAEKVTGRLFGAEKSTRKKFGSWKIAKKYHTTFITMLTKTVAGETVWKYPNENN